MNHIRTVRFSNTIDLLEDANVKVAIRKCLGLDENAYQARLKPNPVTNEILGFKMKIDVICDIADGIKINGEIFDLIAGTAYSSEYPIDIYSLELCNGNSGTISMDIRR